MGMVRLVFGYGRLTCPLFTGLLLLPGGVVDAARRAGADVLGSGGDGLLAVPAPAMYAGLFALAALAGGLLHRRLGKARSLG